MSGVKPIILVDMDGVLADFDGATETWLQANHPHIAIVKRQHFRFSLDYPEHKPLTTSLHTSLGFFRDLPVINGALDGWQRITELGYEPRICSSPLLTHPDCINEKKQWLDRHLGPKVVDTAIFDKHKSRHYGVALIDDKPEIDDAELAIWKHVMFSQPYNTKTESALRLRGWQDPKLDDILAFCVNHHLSL